MIIKIKKLSDDAILPQYQTPGAAGFDLHANDNYTILPGSVALVKTDLAVELPEGYELQVRPRSGMAYKHLVTVLNAPGTVDEDYRDNIGVILINHGDKNYSVLKGERIAQGVISKVEKAEWELVEELEETERVGGFGSTGKN